MSTWKQIDAAMAIIARDHLCPHCGDAMRGIGHDDPWAAKACPRGTHGIPGVDFRPHGRAANTDVDCECDLCVLYDIEGRTAALPPESQ